MPKATNTARRAPKPASQLSVGQQHKYLCQVERQSIKLAPAAAQEVWKVTLKNGAVAQVVMSLDFAVELQNLGFNVVTATEWDRFEASVLAMKTRFHGMPVQYFTEVNGPEHWSPLVKVTASREQGWDVHLQDGTILQSCFDNSTWTIKL